MKHDDEYSDKDFSDSEQLYQQIVYTIAQYEQDMPVDAYILDTKPRVTLLLEKYVLARDDFK